jgi:hypothetical protein
VGKLQQMAYTNLSWAQSMIYPSPGKKGGLGKGRQRKDES